VLKKRKGGGGGARVDREKKEEVAGSRKGGRETERTAYVLFTRDGLLKGMALDSAVGGERQGGEGGVRGEERTINRLWFGFIP